MGYYLPHILYKNLHYNYNHMTCLQSLTIPVLPDLPALNLIALKESFSQKTTWKPCKFCVYLHLVCTAVSSNSLSICWNPIPLSEPSSNKTPVTLTQKGHSPRHVCTHFHRACHPPSALCSCTFIHSKVFAELFSYHMSHIVLGAGIQAKTRQMRSLLTTITEQGYRLSNKTPMMFNYNCSE